MICSAFTSKFSIACVAVIPWLPVAECIHVLVGSLLASKLAIAGLTLVIVVIVVIVVIIVIGVTLVHVELE